MWQPLWHLVKCRDSWCTCSGTKEDKRAKEVETDEDAVLHTKVPRKECSAMLGFLKSQDHHKKLSPEEKLSDKMALEAM